MDKKFFLDASKELESNSVDEALWAKSKAQSSGNQEEISAKYIKLRAHELQQADFLRKSKTVVNDVNSATFSALKTLAYVCAGLVPVFLLAYFAYKISFLPDFIVGILLLGYGVWFYCCPFSAYLDKNKF